METVNVTKHVLVLRTFLRELGPEQMTIGQVSTEWRKGETGSVALRDHKGRMEISRDR